MTPILDRYYHFRLIKHQTKVRLVLNISEKGNPNLVLFNQIFLLRVYRKRILRHMHRYYVKSTQRMDIRFPTILARLYSYSFSSSYVIEIMLQ